MDIKNFREACWRENRLIKGARYIIFHSVGCFGHMCAKRTRTEMAEISTIPISTNERRGEPRECPERVIYRESSEWTGRQFCFGANGVISREGDRIR